MLDLLHSLSVVGQELHAVGVSDDISEKLAIVQRIELDDDQITEATKLARGTSPELWTQLQGQKVVMADVARAFGSIMALAPQAQALRAAAVYTTLLNSQGCPVSNRNWYIRSVYSFLCAEDSKYFPCYYYCF
jgi:hypothetical protein